MLSFESRDGSLLHYWRPMVLEDLCMSVNFCIVNFVNKLCFLDIFYSRSETAIAFAVAHFLFLS